MASAARRTTTIRDDTVTAQTPETPVNGSTPVDTWEWEPATPSDIPSDPSPAPSLSEIADALGTGPALDDYLNLALIGIAGVSLAILLTRARR